jgi:aspartyl-tRNA(Asn)/glutamyl-tRNA(Gln) amidotransferase subunit A
VPRWGFLKAPSFTIPFNLLGWPALSVCSGFGEGGLPVAIQLAARPFEEALLLGTGDHYERAMPWRDRRPAGV